MKFHIQHLYDVIQDLAIRAMIKKFKTAIMSIYMVKNIQTTSSTEPLGQFGYMMVIENLAKKVMI